MKRIFAAAALVIAALPALAEPIGRVDLVQNTVTAENAGTTRPLSQADPLERGDVLASEADARLQATLADDTRITLGENAQLRIDDFAYAPDAEVGTLAVRVLSGTFLLVGGRVEQAARPNVTVTTPFATLGIRGTTVWGGPLDGGFAVFVAEGEVTVTNAGQTVTLRLGEGTTLADAASPPQPAVSWGQAKIDRALATVAFAD